MRYEVKINTVLSSWFDIEADNEEEAKEKAYAEYDTKLVTSSTDLHKE